MADNAKGNGKPESSPGFLRRLLSSPSSSSTSTPGARRFGEPPPPEDFALIFVAAREREPESYGSPSPAALEAFDARLKAYGFHEGANNFGGVRCILAHKHASPTATDGRCLWCLDGNGRPVHLRRFSSPAEGVRRLLAVARASTMASGAPRSRTYDGPRYLAPLCVQCGTHDLELGPSSKDAEPVFRAVVGHARGGGGSSVDDVGRSPGELLDDLDTGWKICKVCKKIGSIVGGVDAPGGAPRGGFPGGPDGAEESAKWIATADPSATDANAVRGKLRRLLAQGFTVAIPGETTHFAFWIKLRGPSAATELSADEARKALDAGGAGFTADAFLAKGGKVWKLAAPIIAPTPTPAPATEVAVSGALGEELVSVGGAATEGERAFMASEVVPKVARAKRASGRGKKKSEASSAPAPEPKPDELDLQAPSTWAGAGPSEQTTSELERELPALRELDAKLKNGKANGKPQEGGGEAFSVGGYRSIASDQKARPAARGGPPQPVAPPAPAPAPEPELEEEPAEVSGAAVVAVAGLLGAVLVAAGGAAITANILYRELYKLGIVIVPPKKDPPAGATIVEAPEDPGGPVRKAFVATLGETLGGKALKLALKRGWRYAKIAGATPAAKVSGVSLAPVAQLDSLAGADVGGVSPLNPTAADDDAVIAYLAAQNKGSKYDARQLLAAFKAKGFRIALPGDEIKSGSVFDPAKSPDIRFMLLKIPTLPEKGSLSLGEAKLWQPWDTSKTLGPGTDGVEDAEANDLEQLGQGNLGAAEPEDIGEASDRKVSELAAAWGPLEVRAKASDEGTQKRLRPLVTRWRAFWKSWQKGEPSTHEINEAVLDANAAIDVASNIEGGLVDNLGLADADKTRIANIHARMKVHNEAVEKAKEKVGGEPEFREYLARWQTFVGEMNKLGERADSFFSYISTDEIRNAEQRLNLLITELEAVGMKIELRRREKLNETLAESARIQKEKEKAGTAKPAATKAEQAASDAALKEQIEKSAGATKPGLEKTAATTPVPGGGSAPPDDGSSPWKSAKVKLAAAGAVALAVLAAAAKVLKPF